MVCVGLLMEAKVRHAMSFVLRSVRQVLDLVFPPRCAGCHKIGEVFCSDCLSLMTPIQPPYCRCCQARIVQRDQRGRGDFCSRCYRSPLYLTGLRAVSYYQDPLRSCIHSFKYDGNTRLADPLGRLLAMAYLSLSLSVDMIIPVPLHRKRLQQRGYNQAYLLARVFATYVKLPLASSALIRMRDTASQAHLQAHERLQNVQGAFQLTHDHTIHTVKNRSILLIDDVYTTGATLEACANPLVAAGARTIWGLVLARPL